MSETSSTTVVTFKLPKTLVDALTTAAKERATSRNQLAKEALVAYMGVLYTGHCVIADRRKETADSGLVPSPAKR